MRRPGARSRPGHGRDGCRSITKNTYRRRRVTAQSTWKKSQASIVVAWLRRNCRQVVRSRCGAGGIRSRFSTRRTVGAPTRLPRPSNSPWIRLYPSSDSPAPSARSAPRSWRRCTGVLSWTDRSTASGPAAGASAAAYPASLADSSAAAWAAHGPGRRAQPGSAQSSFGQPLMCRFGTRQGRQRKSSASTCSRSFRTGSGIRRTGGAAYQSRARRRTSGRVGPGKPVGGARRRSGYLPGDR